MKTNQTRKIAPAAVTALLAVLPVAALAKGDPVAGQQKAAACQACHGTDGHSVDPTYPNLAGQHESYLVKALADYRAGRRNNPIMNPMAVNLTDQDIEDLAAWYASQHGLQDIKID